MKKNLVIVESPAKAKTIEKFLGDGFVVKSCFGHIRDLNKKGISIDIENGFKPIYEVSDDKKKVVQELKSLAKKAETIWLASDEDREGEAISWHLSEVLELEESKTKRIVFHEITKSAILKAIENPRNINKDLVDAQQARRILDRLVGYELSPVLWKKVKPQLSAGRVQSVAVRLLVEREREIQAFQPSSSFKIVGVFKHPNGTFRAELDKKNEAEKEVYGLLNSFKSCQFEIDDLTVKPSQKKPSAPFTTSTLQQEASRKLGFSVTRTMLLAQKLYEAGHITYMRTDSVNLSDFALQSAEEVINANYGKEYHQKRKYNTKSNSAQEAHEAIRPTNFNKKNVPADSSESRLYELIWKRAIASQMSNALLEKTTIAINNSQDKPLFKAKGEVVTFDGFLKIYLQGSDEEQEETFDDLLPKVSVGDGVMNEKITATQRFTRHPARFTEASLVKKLEELGIGRPSTYAPTITTIQKRGYVEKEIKEGKTRNYTQIILQAQEIKAQNLTEITGAEKNKLSPTDIGKVVTDFLNENFKTIMDYGFTASVEKNFDEIAQGYKKWSKMIDEFYDPFHQSVDTTLNHSARATGERFLGEDPQSSKPIIARISRFGPVIQIGKTEDDEKPKFANLRKGQTIDTINLEEALELFKLPRIIGNFEENEMKVSIGRFGPYVLHDSKFYSLNKELDPYTVNAEKAIEVIKEKRKRDAEKIIKKFDEEPTLLIQNGRWGPYISFGKKNYKIPKETDPKTLDYESCMTLIEEQSKMPKKRKKK